MTKKVYALDTKPGIQRDGTVFDRPYYTEGQWVRFQRGRPRKIGGYRAISEKIEGPSRGIYVNPRGSFNNIYNGYRNGIQLIPINNDGVGSGLSNLTLSDFTPDDRNLYQFDTFTNTNGSGLTYQLAHPGLNLFDINNEENTPVLAGDITGTSMSALGVFTDTVSTINGTPYLTFSITNNLIGAGQTVSGTGIPANTTVTSTQLEAPALSNVAVTGTGGQMSCTSTSGLFVNQSVTVGGNALPITLSSVAITGSGGTFSCASTSGLAVGQPVNVSGTPTTQTLASVAITGTEGTFSCTATTGLYVGMPVRVTGTQTPATLASVQVTGTAGQCTCTATNGLYLGQPILVTGTLTGTATGIAGNQIYYIIATNGTSSFTLSSAPDGTAITTTAGTTTGLTFKAPLFSGVDSNTTYYITATNTTSTFTLSKTQNGPSITTINVALTGLIFTAYNTTGITSGTTYYIIATNGSTTFTLSSVLNGEALTNTYGSTTGLTFQTVPDCGINTNTTYYIISTNGATTFTLSETEGGSAITTVVGSITGYTFTLGLYQKVTISNNATVTGTNTLTFDNQVDVSGGVVVLHPYIFVYGNNGYIRNCASGDFDDWVSAEANEVNVATGKIVKGLPVRGGSNSPSGLFWSVDSLIRVSYSPTTINVGSTAITQYWRYDIITSQTSILSSQCVIEYDGIYYWIGTDRFMLYNGVAKEIPNSFNQNYFFDNLNYNQRQKVWATKVPRFGEVWWFYPRGDSEECNDAIIYNIREDCWYDLGEAVGARRSAGYFSQVFRYPVMAGSDIDASGGIEEDITLTNPGAGYVDGTYSFVPLSGGSGSGATATVTVAGGIVTNVNIEDMGIDYAAGESLTVSNAYLGGAGSGLVITVGLTADFVTLWEHEFGYDLVKGSQVLAIPSSFITSDLGWVAGSPSEYTLVGDNRWLDIERVEPDFIMTGTMQMDFIAKPYAQSSEVMSVTYTFESGTGKVDVRFQGRELRLAFLSNEVGGTYQCGRIMLHGYFGDVRGY